MAAYYVRFMKPTVHIHSVVRQSQCRVFLASGLHITPSVCGCADLMYVL